MGRLLAALLGTLLVLPALAAVAAETSPWTRARESTLPAADSARVLARGSYRVWALDAVRLRAILALAPVEDMAGGDAVLLALPMPDGRLARFRIQESPILAPELAARFPEIRTYSGQGVDDPTATVRFDLTPQGFHAMVLRPGGTTFVDPWARDDQRFSVAYDKKAYTRSQPTDFRCLVTGDSLTPDQAARTLWLEPQAMAGPFEKRTYRLAVAATGEYTQFYGGTVAAGLAAITTTMNRVNGIYERDLTVRMQLVAGETNVIYTDPATDPYTNGDLATLITENQANLDSVIGNANYDVGHVFSTASGGYAGLGVVCNDSLKAQAATGSSRPAGDAFDVDFVAHEMGHQFGANHTFNGTTAGCVASQRNQATAMEPGSGSTIMAYAGICGTQNLQYSSDDYFHAVSLGEIQAFTSNAATGGSCDSTSAPGHSRPTVTAPADLTIPKLTPFALTAAGNDVDGDPLTYAWEEFDTGTASPPDTDATAIRPILRSFDPTSSASRTFPKLSDILANTASYGESLPSRARTLAFRVTVRDNHAGAGGTNFDDVNLTVAGAGPFAVTAPAAAANWPVGSTQTVTWSVAGTAGAPINCVNVRIQLSSDGGNTFSTDLAASTANDGTEAVVVPDLFTTQGRVKVDSGPCGNVFFDISSADVTIAPALDLSPLTASIAEGNAGTTNRTFTVTLTPASSQTVMVNYATQAGTAAAPADFVATSGTLTFIPGDTVKTFDVPVNGDTTYEKDETFKVTISGAAGALIDATKAQAVVTITNDDIPPTVSVNDAAILEGNAGTRALVFTATLSEPSGILGTVRWATADGTATAGSDYFAASGTLTFAPGVSSRPITTIVKGDLTLEGPESYTVNLNTPVDLTIADGTGLGTILDDDGAGEFAFATASTSVSEGVTLATIRVVRTMGWAGGSSVDYIVSDGTATAPADYTATFGTLAFAPYQTYATFTVPIVRDTLDEANETALLRLANPVGPLAVLGAQRTSLLQILDNDSGGKLVISPATSLPREGASVPFTVRRVGGVASGVSVTYSTSDGTAVAGTHYTSTAGVFNFALGETLKTFSVSILSPPGLEGNRTVNVALSAPTGGATLGTPSASVITIQDDLPSVQFAYAQYTVSEALTQALITVRRTGPLTAPASVTYQTVAGGTAIDGLDYTGVLGTLDFPAGVAAKTFKVPILLDSLTEPAETVILQIAANPPGSVGIGTAPKGTALGTATLTITDNDPQPYLQFTAATLNASETLAKAIVTVKRLGGLSGTLTVDYATADGTTGTPATAGLDYTATNGTLTFAPGIAARTFGVSILPDTLDEGTETIDLTLSNPIGGALLGTPSVATLRLLDNEPVVQFAADRFVSTERNLSSIVTVRRLGSTSGTVNVDWATSDGTAVAGSDYRSSNGTLTFGPGIVAQTFQVPMRQDQADEPIETVNLTLSNPQPLGSVALGTPSTAVINIGDDDVAGRVQLSAAASSVSEDVGTATITVTRLYGISGPATIDYATTDGTAVAGVDYTATLGTLTFAANERAKTFTVPIADIAGIQPNRFFNVSLGSPTGGLTLGTPVNALVWIVDND